MVREGQSKTEGVSPCEARRELDRLLTDSRFHGTERARNILLYLAGRHFDGTEGSVKAYAIALDVFGRSSDFDPATDPIVRIEISRLRAALAQYYEAFGGESDIVISLPKGNYVTVFTRTTPVDAPPEKSASDTEQDESRGQPEARSTVHPFPVIAHRAKHFARPNRVSSAAVVCALILITAMAVWRSDRPVLVSKPTVSVTISSPQPELTGEATQTRDMLLTALTQFQTLTVALDKPHRATAAGRTSERSSSDYTIELKYYGDSDDRSVWWQVADTRSGDLLKAGIERIDAEGKSPLVIKADIVSVLARRFASTRGVINTILAHAWPEDALGNACVLRAEYQLDVGEPAGFAGVRRCLEETVALAPSDADAIALLSRATVAASGPRPSPAELSHALQLARRAAAVAPLSDRAQVALMLAQFQSGQTRAAIDAGNRALALNPDSPEAAGKLALVLFLSGYFEAGAALAGDASGFTETAPRDASLVLALDAYRRRDWIEAALLSE